jgi:hypothetical protein
MRTIEPRLILSGIPSSLREPLLEEFRKLIRNYAEMRWEPAELNGGKLCEIVYSIIVGRVEGSFPSRPSKPRNLVDACRALERNAGVPRSLQLQIPRLLIALYEVRNGRNVGHVGGDVDPNHMDSNLVVSMAQWLMAELVRLFHDVSTQEATAAVESLIERRTPLLWRVGDRVRVLNASMSYKDKAFVVLYGASSPIKARDLVANVEYSNASVFRKSVLKPAHKAALIDFNPTTDEVCLSPLGVRYVEENIPLTI